MHPTRMPSMMILPKTPQSRNLAQRRMNGRTRSWRGSPESATGQRQSTRGWQLILTRPSSTTRNASITLIASSFDLLDTKLDRQLVSKTFDVDDGFLKRIRISQFNPGRTRVVLETDEFTDFSASLVTNPPRLIIDVHNKDVHNKPVPEKVAADPSSAERRYEDEAAVVEAKARSQERRRSDHGDRQQRPEEDDRRGRRRGRQRYGGEKWDGEGYGRQAGFAGDYAAQQDSKHAGHSPACREQHRPEQTKTLRWGCRRPGSAADGKWRSFADSGAGSEDWEDRD